MPDKEIPEFNGGVETPTPADTAKFPHQTVVGNAAKFTSWLNIKTILSSLFAGKTYETEISGTTPAAPANSFLAQPQNTGTTPDIISLYVERTQIEGIARLASLQGTLPPAKLAPSAWNGFVSAGEMIPATTNGAAAVTEETTTNDLNVDGFDFDPATAESVFWVTEIPTGMTFTTFTARAVWKDNGTLGTGGVVFEISARLFADGESLDQALGSAAQINDTIGTAGHVRVSDISGTCTPAGGAVAENDYLVVKISRNPSDVEDTYTEDARLLGIMLAFS